MAPTQQLMAISSGLMVSWPISGMVSEAAVTMATVAEPRTIRIRAAMQKGMRTAGMGSPTTILPRTLPIPEARTT